jgi:hypothetical protein
MYTRCIQGGRRARDLQFEGRMKPRSDEFAVWRRRKQSVVAQPAPPNDPGTPDLQFGLGGLVRAAE